MKTSELQKDMAHLIAKGMRMMRRRLRKDKDLERRIGKWLEESCPPDLGGIESESFCKNQITIETDESDWETDDADNPMHLSNHKDPFCVHEMKDNTSNRSDMAIQSNIDMAYPHLQEDEITAALYHPDFLDWEFFKQNKSIHSTQQPTNQDISLWQHDFALSLLALFK